MSSTPSSTPQRSGELEVAAPLADFVREAVLPGLEIEADAFWASFEEIVSEFGPRHQAMLDRRDDLQAQIDAWHIEHRGAEHDQAAYENFLTEIGYLQPIPESVAVATDNVDPEIASVAGPQLVVPVDNARYALNAANARWGSLYDALYGTDAISEDDGATRGGAYNPVRGQYVIAFGRALLDEHFPLAGAKHADATGYAIVDGAVAVAQGDSSSGLADATQFVGYTGPAESPAGIVLRKNGLHVEVVIDATDSIGATDPASVADIRLESALSTIMDCEDSVATVDADDKVVAYSNWLGLMKGDLTESFTKGDTTITRSLEADLDYLDPQGSPLTIRRRSVLLVRNVGMHLKTDAVRFGGQPIAETILDAAITALCAKHDVIGNSAHRNSPAGSVYIVKPKMHGADEVALANELFAAVEDAIGMARNTLKMGIMDEERRTSLSLAACIAAASERVVFINTGFLDRTGDEIHTSMEAGPLVPKGEMKSQTWLTVYEDANVDVGLASGLLGHGQIGKGMWARPDDMAAMLEAKVGHPLSGASCAWVPSPTAATLHALHYLQVDVAARQAELMNRPHGRTNDMLTIPVLEAGRELTPDEVQHELDNNVQGILGYVARWVGQGVGCSKVPDINDVGLMEDRATLRISSQHIANWLHHGVVTEPQVRETMDRMATVVDGQNAGDDAYQPMAVDLGASIPYQAALELVLEGRDQANGYTEFVLTDRRRAMKNLG